MGSLLQADPVGHQCNYELRYTNNAGVPVVSLLNWLQGPEAEALRKKELARLDSEITNREQAPQCLAPAVPHIFKLRSVEALPGSLH